MDSSGCKDGTLAVASLKVNTIANFVGQIWLTIINFALVPLYIKFLGIESYGLIGFFISLQALASVMDLGLSTSANREVARHSGEYDGALAEVLSTLQYVYFAFAAVIIIGFYAASGMLSTSWISAESLSHDTVRRAVIIFGITVGLRWPVALYTGILRGVEKQVKLNVISIVVSSLKGIGSVVFIMFISNSILILLEWHLICGVIEVIFIGTFAWKSLPVPLRPKRSFSYPALRSILGFSATVAGISILAIIIKQIDKMIISKLLPLADVGYYNTAFQACAGIQLFITPISTAVFPRLSSIIKTGSQENLTDVYHKASRMISFAASPVAAIMVFNSYDVLLLWTKSTIVAEKASLALSILACATIFNSVMQASYVLQLAAGLQRIPLINNIIAFALFTPLTYLLVMKLGIIGGAVSWAVYNLLYYSITPFFTHRHVLNGQLVEWYVKDTIPFIVLSLGIFGTIYLVAERFDPLVKAVFVVTGVFLYVLIAYCVDQTIKAQCNYLYCRISEKIS